MKSDMLLQPFDLSKLMLQFICTIIIQGRELYIGGFLKYTFNIGFCSDAYVPISFKYGMMVNTTDWSQLNDLDLPSSQGQRVTRKLGLVQSLLL